MTRLRNVGMLKLNLTAPVIYFILAGPYLYIGETQVIAVKRWGDHFSANGTFVKSLSREFDGDEEYIDLLSEWNINIAAFELEQVVKKVPETQRRMVTQYIEHMAHVEVCGDPFFGPKITLISKTVNTAPRSCPVSWAGAVACELVSMASLKLRAACNF